jgi:uncharacterized membrane protein YgaE (UPF0421/DUF939 family)
MSLLSLIQAKRTYNRESIAIAVVFVVQVAICTFVLLDVYEAFNVSGRLWVLIAAILTLQPGFNQSLEASLSRIVANMLGAFIGVMVGIFLGRSPLMIVGAFTVVVTICEYFRLDKAMRTACVSVVIVLVKTDGSVVHSGIERATAVLIGCMFAMVLQLLTDRYVKPWLLPKCEGPGP